MRYYYKKPTRVWVLVFTLMGGIWLYAAEATKGVDTDRLVSISDENVSTLVRSGKYLQFPSIVSDTLPQANSTQTVDAEFSGGVENFKNLFSRFFDTSSLSESSGNFATIIHIDIDADGSVDNIKAEGDNSSFNRLAVRAAKRAVKRGSWSPATENGSPIKSTFLFPVQMNLDPSSNGRLPYELEQVKIKSTQIR